METKCQILVFQELQIVKDNTLVCQKEIRFKESLTDLTKIQESER